MKSTHENVVWAVENFYKLLIKLPYIDPAALVYPPGSGNSEKTINDNSGWPNINTNELRKRGKTDEAITILRYLPYLRQPRSDTADQKAQKRWMLAPDTIAIAYCDGDVYSDELDSIQPTPGHCIWLTDPANTESGAGLLLDTENSTITEYSVRTNRTIGLSISDYNSLPREDRWMAHFTWPVTEFFETWRQKYESLEWLPVYHDEGMAGTAIWFITPLLGKLPYDNSDSTSEAEDEDEYEDDSEDEEDPYEWDSEYESEDDYDFSSEEDETSLLQENQESKSESLAWTNYSLGYQVRLSDGNSLDSEQAEAKVKEARKIYYENGWPDSLNRDQCHRQLSKLVETMTLLEDSKKVPT